MGCTSYLKSLNSWQSFPSVTRLFSSLWIKLNLGEKNSVITVATPLDPLAKFFFSSIKIVSKIHSCFSQQNEQHQLMERKWERRWIFRCNKNACAGSLLMSCNCLTWKSRKKLCNFWLLFLLLPLADERRLKISGFPLLFISSLITISIIIIVTSPVRISNSLSQVLLARASVK
jgi:hypothetical protein